MSLIDYIKNIINNGKQNAQIYSQTLQKTYGENQPLEIGVYNGKKPITDTNINIIINGQKYTRKTDNEGIARLNINLIHGSYTATIDFENEEYNHVTTVCDVIIKPVQSATRMEGINLTKNYGDSTPYQCAVYNEQNNRIRESVNITVNGRTYTKQADAEGLYKLNINLNQGTYPIKAEYLGNDFYKPSYVNNTITIKPKPVDPPKPSLRPYMRDYGCSGMGQCNGYYCACNSVQQAIYRLTGEHISESTLARVGGTTTDGTGHDGINTMFAWFNREYGYNLKVEWKHFSDIGYDKLQEYINNGAVIMHILYRNEWGHYEIPVSVGNGTITVLNSLGEYCSYPAYCGYEETRSQSTHTSYVNGISQKSVCIITHG